MADFIEADYIESLPPIPGPEPTDKDFLISGMVERARAALSTKGKK